MTDINNIGNDDLVDLIKRKCKRMKKDELISLCEKFDIIVESPKTTNSSKN